MKYLFIACFLALALFVLSGCSDAETRINADYVFENVNVIPMNEQTIIADQAVAVRDGLIVAIVDASEMSNIVASERIDGQGAYLMPGLSDMHVHLRMDAQPFFDLQLAKGITTVHNMGNGDGGGKIDHVALRAEVAAGTIDGPRYLISGPQIHQEQVPTLAEIEPFLTSHMEHGYDTMKIHGDLAPDVYDALIKGARARGIRITGHAQHMMPHAQTLRMDAMEHVEEFLYSSPDSVFGEAAAGGVDEYLSAYYANLSRLTDPAYRAGIAKDFAASGIFVDPTLIIYTTLPQYIDDKRFAELPTDPRIAYLPEQTRLSYLDWEKNEYRAGLGPLFEKFLNKVEANTTPAEHLDQNIELMTIFVKELHDAGVPLLLGSDAFGLLVPGYAAHQELELMVEAGLTPYEALRTGTVNAAAYLGESDKAGTIEIGKRADFILVAGNPLDSIENAAQIRGVYSKKKWRSAAELEMRLDQIISPDLPE
jgi:imidazolonepropionase-like amidohydrolase